MDICAYITQHMHGVHLTCTHANSNTYMCRLLYGHLNTCMHAHSRHTAGTQAQECTHSAKNK